MAETTLTLPRGGAILPLTAAECRALGYVFMSRALTLRGSFNARCCESAAFAFDGAAHALDLGMVEDARESFTRAHAHLLKIQRDRMQ